jgi:hypothetical protein
VSRPAVAVLCAAVLLAGFIAGRVTGTSGTARRVTVSQTVEHVVVMGAKHLGYARDPRDRGPLDLVRVDSVRRGVMLRTTIVAGRAWHDSIFRGGRVTLSVLYDPNDDGRPDRRDVVFLFHGRLTSWISSLGQGVQAADVTRPSATAITIGRDTSVFYNASGEAGLQATSPIGVAVVARWRGGEDRVPNRGWITVPPPAGGVGSGPSLLAPGQ